MKINYRLSIEICSKRKAKVGDVFLLLDTKPTKHLRDDKCLYNNRTYRQKRKKVFPFIKTSTERRGSQTGS